MTPTDFWYKLVDMTQSNTSVFTVGGVSISEKQLLWVVGISALLIIILLIRFVIMWVLGSSPKQKPEAVSNATPAPVSNVATGVAAAQVVASTPAVGTPQELLADTSDRKRSLTDFVTPDTIHADVMKQTLNNDFPYNTLKPDPTKINGTGSTQTSPTQTFETPAPVLPPLPSTPLGASAAQPPQTQTLPPLQTAPVAAPLTPQPVTTTVSVPPATVFTPSVSEVVIPVPQPAATNTILPPTTVLPSIPQNPVTPPIVAEVPQQPAPVVAPEVVTTVPVAPAAPEMPPKVDAAPSTNASVLPPLPPKEPTAQMVVGVADSTTTPITKSTFNPTDPIIP